MENSHKDKMIGKKIRVLRNKSGMTQDELAQELNVTRQAVSNWERDINEPDLNTIEKICFVFGIKINDLMMEVMKMGEMEKQEEREMSDKKNKRFNKYDLAIGLFYAAGLFMGIGIFFTVGFITMTAIGWAASLFAGICFFLVFGLLAHAVITLKRKDK